MIQLMCCIKKDILELTRQKRTFLFNGLLASVTIMVLGSTLGFPFLIELLTKRVPDVVADGSQLQQVMVKLFPQTTRENMGIWSSDVVIIFTIVISMLCGNVLRKEVETGKWIMVLASGYSPWKLLISKILVYGIYLSVLIMLGYNIYYSVGSYVLIDNFTRVVAVGNSIVLAIAVFFITTWSITLSVIYKNSIMAILTVIITVLVAPDIFSLFSFGRFLPTYLLTFVYLSLERFNELAIPFILLLLLQIGGLYIAVKKIDQIKITR